MGNLFKTWYRALKILRMATRFLVQRKLRSALSVLGVVCGVMAVLAMISIGEGAKREAIRQIERLGTKNIYIKAIPLTQDQQYKARERLSQGLDRKDVARIKASCPHVKDVAALREIKASVRASNLEFSPQIVACSPNYATLKNLLVSQGRFITDYDAEYRNLVCVLGDAVARSLGPYGKLGANLRIEDHLLRVVGILGRQESKKDETSAVSIRNFNGMIFVPLHAKKALGGRRNKGRDITSDLTEVVVQVDEADQVIPTSALIRRTMDVFHRGVEDYQMVIPLELLNQAQRTRRIFSIVLGAIAGVSLLVGGIGIMNIMLATVSERTKEIGIRRAVGATRADITVQFLGETVILTLAGGVIGIGCGLGAVRLVTEWAGWATAVTFYAVMIPLLMSLLVGVFFGLYPACQAARMDPIVALRHE